MVNIETLLVNYQINSFKTLIWEIWLVKNVINKAGNLSLKKKKKENNSLAFKALF